jgi:hypothetical protein
MALRARDLLIVAVVTVLVIAAVIFAVVLPAMELQQVRRNLESPPAATPHQTIPTVPTLVPVTTVIQGPPEFSLLVTPVEARAPPGETVLYNLTVEPRGGFDHRIALRLDVSALFLYRESFDLGTIDPPYPKTFEYRFVVPADVPSGITVKGVISGEGGGYRDTVDLILLIT